MAHYVSTILCSLGTIFFLTATPAYSNSPANCSDHFVSSYTNPKSSNKAQKLIEHVIYSINKAQLLISRLNPQVLHLEGMSGLKGRHLLNNLCSFPGTHYLEIGVWKGSTFISALYGNHDAVKSAIAIDNWSEFGGKEKDFLQNVFRYLPQIPLRSFSQNCFQVDKSIFTQPINIYFYDGNHSLESQEKAFTYFNDVLDDVFIAIVDDWNWDVVKQGTFSAFNQLGYNILFSQELLNPYETRHSEWWNSLYIAVISKK